MFTLNVDFHSLKSERAVGNYLMSGKFRRADVLISILPYRVLASVIIDFKTLNFAYYLSKIH